MQHPDHYIIERRGGFAGLKASGRIDGDAMDPDDRHLLETLLDSTREIPESVMPPTLASVVAPEI
jgi:hypothetical protein